VDERGGGPGAGAGAGAGGRRAVCWAGLPEMNRRVAVRWLAVLAGRVLSARGLDADVAVFEVADVAGAGGRR